MSILTEGAKVTEEQFIWLKEIIPDFEKFRDWTSWEQNFVNNMARNLGAYKEELFITSKQLEVLKKLEKKCYGS